MSRLLGFDPITQKTDTWHDEPDGGVVVASEQDVTDIIEQNKEDYNARSGFKGDWHHVARIPLAIYEDLMRKGIADDPARLKKWLDNPDNRAFRSHPGKVGR
jgi:hypothetical protein